jgi:2-polyprenyl-3-methyl-5-hydroxy-6-metoxy-1,4-benzoquinol methylase
MLLNFFKRKIVRDQKTRWDHQYEKGKWEYLNDALEAERFQAVLTATQSYSANGSILEIGCGEGILQSRMKPDSYSRYMGIDLSEVAIQKAAHLCNGHTSYQAADMETFTTEEKFDVVLFNESLYYAKKPLLLLQQYAGFLKPGGYLILSIYQTTDNQALLNRLSAAYAVKEEQVSTNERGSWCCQVYEKKAVLS